jgi:integrase/recombinase XerD
MLESPTKMTGTLEFPKGPGKLAPPRLEYYGSSGEVLPATVSLPLQNGLKDFCKSSIQSQPLLYLFSSASVKIDDFCPDILKNLWNSQRRYVREFLEKFFGDKTVDPFRLAPKDVIRYVSKRASRLTPASTKPLASSLRSYFRFLRLHGQCDEALTLAVPTSAKRRLSSLPRVLTDDEIKRLLAAFSRKTAMGRRDYAITRCLTDLGLRAGEVARLRLDDIDWRNGKLRIIGAKSRREDELPLPAAVAESIADFILRGRPETPERQVFVRLHPPIGKPFNMKLVRGVIRRAAARAGLESIVTGTQILRHTAASRMLRNGASIKEVADVLRHRSLDTTAIYTKVDLPRLAAVAMAWPKEENL